MRHALYEDPITHRFALIRLPAAHIEDDAVSIPPIARWFAIREEALAAIADLFDQDDDGENGYFH